MSRTEKLYRRLEELEGEYRDLVRREWQSHIETRCSRVLSTAAPAG